MTGRAGAVVELVVALAATIGSVLSWLAAVTTMQVPPIIEGEPTTISVVYSPPLLTLSLLLATVAGVLVVLGVVRMRRGRALGGLSHAPGEGDQPV